MPAQLPPDRISPGPAERPGRQQHARAALPAAGPVPGSHPGPQFRHITSRKALIPGITQIPRRPEYAADHPVPDGVLVHTELPGRSANTQLGGLRGSLLGHPGRFTSMTGDLPLPESTTRVGSTTRNNALARYRSGMSTRPASGKRWLAFARSVVDHYGGVCWCGHGGARQVDHIIPVTERPDLVYDMTNCRAAHGAPGNPCIRCSRDCGRNIYCNQLRGGYSIERAQRKIAELAAAHAAGKRTNTAVPRVRGDGTATAVRTGEAPGRVW